MKLNLQHSRTMAIVAAAILGVNNASAATVTPTFINVGTETGTAQDSGVWRADLNGLGLTQVGSISVSDSNSGVDGSPGAYSGFDIDALFLDIDGDYATTDDQHFASSFIFSAGSVRATSNSTFDSNTSGALNGSNADGTVDEAFATLNAIDAVFFGAGSLSLGDGGTLIANFTPEVIVGSSLFIIGAEVGDNGESITGLIEVSDTPATVPLPAGLPMLLAGLGAMVGIRRRNS
ncbi:MAG: VPLPA-CTERM sorting domain-containing protein [Litoreibacter sp.]